MTPLTDPTLFNTTLATPNQPSKQGDKTWTIIFGTLAVVTSVITIWQGCRKWKMWLIHYPSPDVGGLNTGVCIDCPSSPEWSLTMWLTDGVTEEYELNVWLSPADTERTHVSQPPSSASSAPVEPLLNQEPCEGQSVHQWFQKIERLLDTEGKWLSTARLVAEYC